MWNDVELLDGRFAEGDAVRVLGRVEKFRDRLQLDVRSLEASDVDPDVAHARDAAGRRRAARASSSFSSRRSRIPGWPRRCARCSPTATSPPGRRRRTTITPTRAACSSTRSAWRRSAARRRSSIRACVPTCCSRRRSLHDVGRTLELGRGPAIRAHRRGPAARPRPPRAAADRGARGGALRGAARGAPALRRVPSRRARGAHGRGVRALPREPARRRRSDAPGRLTPLLLALGASLAWGVADFVGPLLSRTLGLLRMHVLGAGGRRLRAIAIVVAIRGDGPAGWGVLFAVAGGDRRDARARRVLPRHADRGDERRRADRGRVGGDPGRLRDRDRRRPVRTSARRDRRARCVGVALASVEHQEGSRRWPPESGSHCSRRSASGSTSRGCMQRARSTSGGRR